MCSTLHTCALQREGGGLSDITHTFPDEHAKLAAHHRERVRLHAPYADISSRQRERDSDGTATPGQDRCLREALELLGWLLSIGWGAEIQLWDVCARFPPIFVTVSRTVICVTYNSAGEPVLQDSHLRCRCLSS